MAGIEGRLLRIGASTLCFFQERFETLLEKLPTTGITLWEIADEGLHSLDQDRVKKLNEIRESHDLVFNIHTPWVDVNISALHPNVREKMQQSVMDSIRLAHDLGSEYVIIHPGRSARFLRDVGDLCWRYTAEFLEYAGVFCADHGITPLVENIFPPYFLFHDPDEIERYFSKEAPENLRLVCDFAHANVSGNLLPLVEKVAEYVGYIHLSGNYGQKDEHLPIDEGTVQWREGLNILFEAGFNSPIILENYNIGDVRRSLEALKSFLRSEGREHLC